MKNIHKNVQLFGKGALLIILTIIIYSCEPLEVNTPTHLLSGETVFTDTKTVEAAMINLYANLRDNVLLTGSRNGMSNILGNYADEITYVSAFGLSDEPFFKNNLHPSNETILEIWNGSYKIIYDANAIIEGVTNSEYFTEEEKDIFTGEALFVRGLTHFYLLNLYGKIPYVTTTNYLINQSVSRKETSQVYSLIIADLLKARDLLPEIDKSGEHLRPNKYVASALLSKCYLYTKQWPLAEQYATEVIENNGWETELQNVFLKTSLSTLWQFSPNSVGDPTHEAETFLVLFAPPSERILSEAVVQDFENGDLRKQNWVGEISDGVQTFYFPFKYKIGPGENNSQEYSIVFRMAEQFLIRAEARAYIGNITGSQEDLNKIRLRAGLLETPASTQSELLSAILHERRVELFTEQGHRFFDLKRTENLDNVLSAKPGWNTSDRLFPIPEKELLLNPNLLPQNSGY